MRLPGEHIWSRVEILAQGLANLPPDELSARLAELKAAGEPDSVLTLLPDWLALKPLPSPVGVGSLVGGSYLLLEKLGEGGMGSVWRATQKMIKREVALKMIHPALATPAFLNRFLDEIQVLGRLNHPGIVQIYDADVHEEGDFPPIPYFTMELVDGQPLHQWAADHPKNWPAILRLVAEICAALQNAHERQIVHRDLKPANLIIRPNGQPVVLDFGIATLAGITAPDEPGHFSGTPQYAAPEQHLGRDRDFRSGESVDVYSVGAILFELLTGRRLFEFPAGTLLPEIRRAVLHDPVPRLTEVSPDCPEFLNEIVGRAVRRAPADRYFSISNLGLALTSAVRQLDAPRTVPPPWSPGDGAMVPGTNWRLEKKIGEGGVGQAWTGVHSESGEHRVFKFCTDGEKVHTLKRELTLFRLLKERIGRNPHFIPLHEVSLEEPPWYLMMEWTDARDLETWSAAQPGGLAAVPENTRLEIVSQAAEALQSAHEACIIHRDIKPANLLIKPAEIPEGIHVLVADFGLGQIVAEEFIRGNTRMGFTRFANGDRADAVSGTVLYLAPEVMEGNPATARSDIYSLGVVLWQLLAGNLRMALDPSDWAARIPDPLLREDLLRCLAGDPEKRWASAGELAASLRALPARRRAEQQRLDDLAAREKTAYRRGLLRATLVAAAVLAIVASFAWIALLQRREAERVRGEIALEQARTLSRADFAPGRRARGMQLLDIAAATVTNGTALRTVSAAIVGLPDLVRVDSTSLPSDGELNAQIQPATAETCRVASTDGKLMAVGRDLDGLNGAVEIFSVATGQRLLTIERKQFPWVPVPEPGMLSFSPDNKLLAVGGPATSRQVLIFKVVSGELHTCLFQGADPIGFAWHSGGRTVATGGTDGSVRIWDLTAATVPDQAPVSGSQFDLPPALNVPALDRPAHVLRHHRGPVRHLAFAPSGRWLATLDDAGYLCFQEGFTQIGLPSLPPAGQASEGLPSSNLSALPLAVETRLDNPKEITSLVAVGNRVVVRRGKQPAEAFEFLPSELPAEVKVAPGITELAWNATGTEICVATLTDIHWLKMSPLEIFQSALGNNPAGISWLNPEASWTVLKDRQLVEWSAAGLDRSRWSEQGKNSLPAGNSAESGARAALAAADDGRLAIYRGRRIQFFARGKTPAPETSVLVAQGGETFRKLIWDRAGRTLGVVFSDTSERLRLETWQTSAEFPPRCKNFAPAVLNCQRIVPANDGRHFYARGTGCGIFRFDPETGLQASLDQSDRAAQNAALAASPNGDFLALVTDRQTIRILNLPAGTCFAELHLSRPSAINSLYWDAGGQKIASVTDDGSVQIWNLAPWHSWISKHDFKN